MSVKSYLFLIIFFSIQLFCKSAVTYDQGARLGDKLLAYCHARWFAYIHQLDFYYNPFQLSNYLRIHNLYKLINEHEAKKFKKVEYITHADQIKKIDKENTLYIIPFFPETELENCKMFQIDWKDPRFLQIIKNDIVPNFKYNKILLPKESFNIALHVRVGSGKDQQTDIDGFYWKFMPLTFYVQAAKKVISLFQNKKIYVHVFTDSRSPAYVIEYFKNTLSTANVIVNGNPQIDSSGIGVIIDFFDLCQFDCIIRSDSNFSVMAEILSNPKIVVSPKFDQADRKKIFIKINIDKSLKFEF